MCSLKSVSLELQQTYVRVKQSLDRKTER